MKIDFSAISFSLLLQCPDILLKWFPQGRMNGIEFVIGDLQGNKGNSLSVNTNTGVWKDFASGEGGGDLISLYAAKHGITQGNAAKELGLINDENPEIIIKSPVKKTDKPEILSLIAPDSPPEPKHFKHGIPTAYWFYRNAEGKIIGLVARFNKEMGKKEFIPAIWTKTGWHWKSFPKPRTLYGLHSVAQRPSDPVEGEKAADAAARLLPQYVVVSWAGGAQAAKYADWSVLQGRDVVVWPDADNAGRKAAQVISEMVTDSRIIEIKGDTGFDAADAEEEGWSTEKTLAFVTSKPEPEYENFDHGDLETIEPDQSYFRILGYDADDFYFYSYLGERVVDISRSALGSPAALLQIAPLSWWQRNGMASENNSIKTTLASDMLIDGCYAKGLFNANDCRGRGAWEDNGRSVLHMGDKLIVNGVVTKLPDHKSRYLYEKRHSMDVDYHHPLRAKEAYKLVEICRLIRWEEKISGDLLAGWIVIAPICGALQHRPHIYVLGPASSGKSWVVEEVIGGVLGKTAFVTASKSTAAGIRQALRSDALPVIFDEAEAEEMADRTRLQEVFDLARVSFNGEAAPIHKGTADQSGKSFAPRSCFAFSSINMSMKRYADETRTTILKILQPSRDMVGEAERFSALQKLATETITAEWRGGLLARTVNMIPVIKKNAKIFAHEASLYFGSRRQGDQIGPILAGLYALHSSDIISKEKAAEFIKSKEWPQQKELAEDNSHSRLWKFLQEVEVKVDTPKGGKTRTVSELITVASGHYDDDVTRSAAETELKRKGFRVEEGYVFISNTNSWIEGKLRQTEWPGKWAHTLKSISGAIVSDRTRRFVSSDRCIGIPFDDGHKIGD